MVEPAPVKETETDEMMGFAGDKSRQYWLWRATGHNSGEPLAFYLAGGNMKTRISFWLYLLRLI
jgi:IS1 family transposase